MDTGSGRGKYSYENDTSGVCDVIAVGARHFLNESMGPQQSKFAADGGGATTTLDGRLGVGVIQQLLEVPIAEAVDQKRSLVDGGEQFLIFGPRV